MNLLNSFARVMFGAVLAGTLLVCPHGGALVCAQDFGAGVSYPVSSAVNLGPKSIETADLDEDGNLDLITADNGFLSIFFGDPSGAFNRRESIHTRVGNATDEGALDDNNDVAAADVTGNGHRDLIAVNVIEPIASIRILPNDPVGSFVTEATTVTAIVGEDANIDPSALKVAQLNPLIDPYPDLAVVAFEDPQFFIYLGDGRGNFSPFTQTSLTTNSVGQNLDIGDFNEDGFQDVAIADLLRVRVFFGDGAGGFPSNDSRVTNFSSSASEWDVLMRDMDGDDHLDLVVSNGGRFRLSDHRNSIVVIYGAGTESLSGEIVSIDVGNEVAGLAVADFDNDGNLDIVGAVAEYSTDTGGAVYVRGLGNRVFDVTNTLLLPAMGRGTLSVVAGDFDSNGRPDIALANEGLIRETPEQSVPGNVVVYLNDLPAIDTPTPTQTPTPIPTLTKTPTPTITPTATSTPTSVPTRTPLENPEPGDINEDGETNSKDLLILIEQQGNTAP